MTIWYFQLTTNLTSKVRNIPFRDIGASGKARQDTYDFLDEIGAKPIGQPLFREPKEDPKDLRIRIEGMLGAVKPGDTIIQMLPTDSYSLNHTTALYEYAHELNVKLVGYVHDIDLYRSTYERQLNKEVNIPYTYYVFANQVVNAGFDAIIVPSEQEKIRIQNDFNYDKPIIVSGPVPFKTPMIPPRRKKDNTVIFAGSFAKAKYINSLLDNSPKLKFNIYGGRNYGDAVDVFLEEHPNADYKGKLDPDAMVMTMEGAYGLTWDSDSYPEVSGGMGYYQQVNSPHKLSMYLAAEIPVIVWSKIAFASYVLDNNVGWVIDDLSQLEDLIDSITEEDYQSKLDSLVNIGALIRGGTHFKNSIFESIKAINEVSSYTRKIDADNMPAQELGLDEWIIKMHEIGHDEDILDTLYQEVDKRRYQLDSVPFDNERFKKAKAILQKLEII